MIRNSAGPDAAMAPDPGPAGAGVVDNRRGALLLIAAAAFLTGDVLAVRLLDGRVGDGQIVISPGSRVVAQACPA